MNEQRFETNDAPQVMVTECRGNLVVQSWRETAVSAQSSALTADDTAPHRLTITSQADLYLAVPQKTSLTLGRIDGNLTIKHIDGGVTVEAVGGNVTLRNVDAVTIRHAAQTVAGDNINGLLVITEAGGTVSLRSTNTVQISKASADVSLSFVNGHLTLGDVHGKLEIRTVNGDVTVEKVEGDVILANLGGQNKVISAAQTIWLVGGLRNGAHQLNAAGCIYVYWPPDAPLNLTAQAPQIEHRLSLENAAETPADDQVVLTGHIEESKVDLRLQAGQRAALVPLSESQPQFDEAEFVFETEVEAAWEQQVRTAVLALLDEIAAELPPETVAQLEAVGLAERLVTAVTGLPSEPPQPGETAVPPDDKTAQQRHILQLLQDGQLTIEQTQILLASSEQQAASGE